MTEKREGEQRQSNREYVRDLVERHVVSLEELQRRQAASKKIDEYAQKFHESGLSSLGVIREGRQEDEDRANRTSQERNSGRRIRKQ